ncbi:MAG: peptidase, partial [Verrucomicrobia bacterium]|nr:peptidase [Verrucomicrobiota bacterium]
MSAPTSANPAKFLLHPDQADARDFQYKPPSGIQLPAVVDLRLNACGFPAIFDQGHLNSCTANAIAAVLAFDIRRQKRDDTFEPSRMFVYYNERYRESTIGSPVFGDHGAPAFMRDCIKVVDDLGFCSETIWPYEFSAMDTRPSDIAYRAALEHRSCDYFRIPQTLDCFQACLAEGFPFVCGITIYESFVTEQVNQTGIIPNPAPSEKKLGG